MGSVIANGATGRLYLTASGISEREDPTTFVVTMNAFGQVMAVNAATNRLYASDGNDLQIIDGATDPEKIVTSIALPTVRRAWPLIQRVTTCTWRIQLDVA
jgi:hypothetical protein